MFQSQGRDRLAQVKEMGSPTFLGSRIKKRDSPEYLFLMTQENRWPNVREVILVLGKALIREFPVSKDLQLMLGFKTWIKCPDKINKLQTLSKCGMQYHISWLMRSLNLGRVIRCLQTSICQAKMINWELIKTLQTGKKWARAKLRHLLVQII